jgi:outer membrane receptor protein involved in Fe transport
MNLSYTTEVRNASGEFYLGITNLLDRDPPVDLRNPTSFSVPTQSAYDRAGRYFNAGVRLRF